MSAANRRRGARAEVAVVNFLRDAGWPDARRYLAGDGRQPGDIDWHPLVCTEVKDCQASAWPTWCRQVTQEARDGMVPVVVRRTRGNPDVGTWEARVLLDAWLEVLGQPDDMVGVLHRVDLDGVASLWVATSFGAVVAAVEAVDS